MPRFWPFSHNDESSTFHRTSLIEGIDDDALLLIFFVACLIGLWIYYTRRHRNTTIHPDNRQDVEILRQRNEDHGDTNSRRTSSSHSGRSRQDTCPICLEDPLALCVETNCGHLFCGKCIITFWKFQSNWMSGLKCPVCRQQVTVLLNCFTAEERAAPDSNDRQTVVNGVKDFNRRFSSAQRTWLEYFYDIPVLIPYIIRQVFSTEGLALAYRLRAIVLMIVVIAYVISPFDILPESVLGIFGLLDDLFIVLSSALYIIISFRQITLFTLTLSIRNDKNERFRINHKIGLNNNNTVRLNPCIADDYQNKCIGSYLILSGGVHAEILVL
ncbi:unnamed protein product [Rotaria socialis]|uniref:E3 ubiquitin-protein ligase RNF170 n=1 Tax=Rotaria socialis TaxID=392032 RepID=A0A820WCK9_9BILA|nr:unnamed protein product [Rotaria socialis]CAF4817594.1 unnamed protein product [Rotaria socialis]